jgi:NADPH:quinone reductase-like Zn-dependent oxidoreductase
MRGYYFEKPQLPSRLGFEAAGVVEAVGPGVDRGLIGKQVSTTPGLSQNQHGVLGEEAIVPASSVAEYPPQLTPEEGASIWMQYLTAWGALVYLGKVGAGDAVLIPAASSSVGLAAIQMVKDAGAVSIAATRTSKKRQELIDLGADHVIATEEEDLPARVKEIMGGKGARLIFDPVGGPYVETLAEAAAPGGIIFEYGGLSMQPTPFPTRPAMMKGLSLRGYSLSSQPARSDQRGKEVRLRAAGEGEIYAEDREDLPAGAGGGGVQIPRVERAGGESGHHSIAVDSAVNSRLSHL